MKRQYDTFNDHKEDPTHLYISGRQCHKKSRIATPEVDRIVQKFKANPYGLPSQHENVVEISDSAIFGWWQCLQTLGLWPILPASSHLAKPETEYFFNVIPKNDCSTKSQLSLTDGQDTHMAGDSAEERSTDVPNDKSAIAQEHMEQMSDIVHEDRVEVDKSSMDIDGDQSPVRCTTICSPEELDLVVQAAAGSAHQPFEYSPSQSWLVQVDIANISSNRMEAEPSTNGQELLEDDCDEQEGLPHLSPAPGPIRTSFCRSQKGTFRSSPYDRALQKPSDRNTRKYKAHETGQLRHPTDSNDFPAQAQWCDTDQTFDAEVEAVQPSESIAATPPCNNQINCFNPDDSGYFSDDGLDEAFAEATKEMEAEEAKIEKDRAMYPWKPRMSSPLKHELNAQAGSPPEYPSNLRPSKSDQLPANSDEGRKIRDEMALMDHLWSRNFNKSGTPILAEHCGIGDHRQRYKCRCRSTAAARGILGIGLGHLTPERVRKATHQQLRRIALLDDSHAKEKEKACNAVNSAYRALENLEYGVSCLRRGMPGLADLTNHAERIYRAHELAHTEHMLGEYGYETEEEQEQRWKRQLIQNKGRITPPARRIAKAPRRDKCQHCKKLLLGQRAWDSAWHRHLKEERVHAFHTMPMMFRRGIREPEG